MDEFIDTLSTEELLEKYSKLVYRLAYARTHNVHDAEDITQDVFLKYIRLKKSFCSEEHRKAWLIKVTVNAGKSFVTSAWFRHRAELDETQEDTETVDMPEESEIDYAIKELPKKYREIIYLFYYEDLPIKRICDMLNMKESTAKSLLHRARGLLKDKLKEEQNEL